MEQLVSDVDHLTIGRFVSVAGSTIWVYDYLLTCGYEFTRIWPTKLTLVKALYMINRYIAVPYLGLTMYYMLGTPDESQSKTFCRFYTIVTVILREVEIFAATYLMLIRVQALYGNFRRATWVLYTGFIITHILNSVLGAQSIAQIYSSLAYLPLVRVCLSDIPSSLKLIYFIQIPFELLLLGMQLVHYWKLSRVIAPIKPTPLLTALYTGGVLNFIATISVRVWAGLVVVFLDPTYWYMTVAIDLATTSTFISRIFLHLNEVSSRSTYPASLTTGTSTNFRLKSTSVAPDTWMEMEPHQHRTPRYLDEK